MPREEGKAERREGVLDRQYEVYKESYGQRGLSEELVRVAESGIEPIESVLESLALLGVHAPDEMAACMPWLQRQIATIQPKLLCGLGNIAVQTLLVTKTGITKLRGRLTQAQGLPFFPTFHPAYILRNMSDLPLFEADIKSALSSPPQCLFQPIPLRRVRSESMSAASRCWATSVCPPMRTG